MFFTCPNHPLCVCAMTCSVRILTPYATHAVIDSKCEPIVCGLNTSTMVAPTKQYGMMCVRVFAILLSRGLTWGAIEPLISKGPSGVQSGDQVALIPFQIVQGGYGLVPNPLGVIQITMGWILHMVYQNNPFWGIFMRSIGAFGSHRCAQLTQ